MRSGSRADEIAINVPEEPLLGVGVYRFEDYALLFTVESSGGYDLAARLREEYLQRVLRSEPFNVGV